MASRQRKERWNNQKKYEKVKTPHFWWRVSILVSVVKLF